MADAGEKQTAIMIVDDHPIVRQGLRMIIERRQGFSVTAEASSANEAIRIIADRNPDIVIADISLEGNVNGIDLVKAIKERFPGVATLVLSMYDESLYAERAIRAGARGYVMKKEADETIITAIETVMAGELYLSERSAKNIVGKLLATKDGSELLPENALSDRELEIFIMIGDGIPAREIACSLGISVNTVETHRRHIKEKLRFADLNELVKSAVQWNVRNRR